MKNFNLLNLILLALLMTYHCAPTHKDSSEKKVAIATVGYSLLSESDKKNTEDEPQIDPVPEEITTESLDEPELGKLNAVFDGIKYNNKKVYCGRGFEGSSDYLVSNLDDTNTKTIVIDNADEGAFAPYDEFYLDSMKTLNLPYYLLILENLTGEMDELYYTIFPDTSCPLNIISNTGSIIYAEFPECIVGNFDEFGKWSGIKTKILSFKFKCEY